MALRLFRPLENDPPLNFLLPLVSTAHCDKVARSFQNWGQKLKKAGRKGRPMTDFIRDQLDALGIGKDLHEVAVGQKRLRLRPTVSLAAQTQLAQTG